MASVKKMMKANDDDDEGIGESIMAKQRSMAA